jgi:hypothetical protein
MQPVGGRSSAPIDGSGKTSSRGACTIRRKPVYNWAVNRRNPQ